MAIERSMFLEILKDAYSAYYTIFPAEEPGELPLCFRAEYCSRDEQYFLSKKANIWSNEKREYAYVFSAPGFDAETVERCMDWALEEMLPKVRPHKQHQYTNCKVIFVADELDDEVMKAIRKRRFSRSYGFLSTQGYTELLCAGVDLHREKTVTNPMGRELAKFFGKLFALRREETQSK